jgi:hypothetical protein
MEVQYGGFMEDWMCDSEHEVVKVVNLSKGWYETR